MSEAEQNVLPFSRLAPATGYMTTETFYGTRFSQGDRVQYLLDLTLLQIMSLVPRPNPDVPTPGNRRINLKHAEGFADYLRKTPQWVSPGLILRVDRTFDFDALTDKTVTGVAFGTLSFTRQAAQVMHILDGQHRILGAYLALDQINADRDKLRQSIQRAKRNELSGGVRELETALAEIDRQAKVFESQSVPVQIVVEADAAKYRQAFYDIAENAKGITASVRARFDSRKAVNRALEEILLDTPLLAGRVEAEADRLRRTSPHLLTVKHVSEIIRARLVGYEGRIGKRIEASLDDRRVVNEAKEFFNTLVECFPQMHAIENNTMTPDQLRATSLLGSPVFLRILAAFWHDALEHHITRERIKEFYRQLADHVAAPVTEDSVLFQEIGLPAFLPGQSAPSARRQDAAMVVDAFVAWVIMGSDALGVRSHAPTS